MNFIKKITINIYSFINKIFFLLWFKLDYIWSARYIWIKNLWITNILDVWANKWQSIERWKILLWKDINFYCFEPLKSPFSILKNKYWNNNKIKLLNIWLWSTKEDISMNVSNIDDSSSIFEPTDNMKKTYENIKFENKEIIKIDTLDNIFTSMNIKWNILMKIDTQWYELETLKWSLNSLKNISIIVVELSFSHFYKDQPLFWDVFKFLDENWFIYYWSFEQSWDPKNGKPMQQDAIFVNKNILNKI